VLNACGEDKTTSGVKIYYYAVMCNSDKLQMNRPMSTTKIRTTCNVSQTLIAIKSCNGNRSNR